MFGIKPKNQPLPTFSQEPAAADTGSFVNEARDPVLTQRLEAPASQQQTSVTEENQMMESDLTASVSRNTIFTGNISSQDNVEIFGEVEGSVTSAAVVKIHGKVHGDVSCGVLIASNAAIVGNIDCEKSAVFGNDTNVNGNVTATVVTVSGQINGNINASESVSVSSSGTIYGDITTPEIEVSKGAIVFGSVVMEHAKEAPAEDPPVQAPQPEEAKPDLEASDPMLEPQPKAAPDDDSEDSLGPLTAERKPESKGHNPFSIEDHK